MVTSKIYDKLSKGAKQELEQLVNGKENAFDMLVNNHFGNMVCSADEITSRMQMQYFALNPDENTLQQDGRNGWWQNEAYEMSSVNSGITPVMEVEGDFDNWGEAYYSSFALSEMEGSYNLRYPLDDDYTSSVEPFKNLSMSDLNYNVLVRQIQNNLNVKIAKGKVSGKSLYKRSFPSLAVVKIKNIGLKLAGKGENAQTAFKGTLTLADKTKGSYKYSNIEKVVKIYDELFRVGIAKQVKYNKAQFKGADRDIKFASRLFANILMARITDYGNAEINKKVEKCLSLQFANVLNRAGFSSFELQMVTTLGSSVVVDTCKSMGITTQRLIQKMVTNGYQYQQVPSNELEAIMFAKEKDYSKYLDLEQNLQTSKTSAKILELPPINTAPLELKAANAVEISPRENVGLSLVSPKSKAALAGVKAKNILPAGQTNDALPQARSTKALPAGARMGALQSGKTSQEVLPASEMENAKRLSGPSIAGFLPAKSDSGKYSSVRYLPSGNMYNMQTMADRLLLSLPEEIKKQQLETAKANYEASIDTSKPVTAKTIEKTFDKAVIKILSEKVVGINTKLNAHRYSAVGGKEDGEKSSDLYSQVLSYYTNSVNSRKTVSEGKDTTTLYSLSKKLCDKVIETKKKLVHKVTDGEAVVRRDASESTAKFINRRVKEITTTKANPEGLSVKDFFKGYLEKLPQMYAKMQAVEEKKQEPKTSQEKSQDK